jgi:hypothetical protein
MPPDADPREIDAIFGAIAQRKRVGRMAGEIHDPDFWRALNPELTISDAPIAGRVPPTPMPLAEAEAHARHLIAEGYLLAPPLFSTEEITRLRVAVERVVAQGLPSGFAWLYDECYGLFARLEHVLMPMLGPSPLMLPEDFWVFHVPADTPDRTGFGAYGPHRDYVVDRHFLEGGLPRVLSIWIPLTDVTPLDSCMYVVHPDADPDYHSESMQVRPEALVLQGIRALPTPAGGLIAFSTRVAHWGSRSSAEATGPRISITCLLQRRDTAPFLAEVLDLTQGVTWERRLRLVMSSLGATGLEGDRLPPSAR